MKEIKPSVCPYDCPDCCGLLITVEDGKAVLKNLKPTGTIFYLR